MSDQRFWEIKSLKQMTRPEWESLCDGCARCCLQKLEDEESGDVYYTDLACHFLDLDSCRCKDYEKRSLRVHNCISLTPDNMDVLQWLPDTCAYRLIAEGKGLYAWHPLISGSADSVLKAGVSIHGRCLSETDVPDNDWEDHLIDWVQIG
ncbi:MAG: YcgN family cysteine cluster protein [Pseudomonadales bacterium]|nr:YcgN family cysteine cluster protein [Pseudomonadales bacterium]